MSSFSSIRDGFTPNRLPNIGDRFKAEATARKLLTKINQGKRLTSKEIRTFNNLSKSDLKFTAEFNKNSSILNRVTSLQNKRDFSRESLQKIIRQEKRQAALEAPTKTPTIASVKRGTKDYTKRINRQQEREAERYQDLLRQQRKTFDRQLQVQNKTLDRQLQTISKQAVGQQQLYKSLLEQTTSQQKQELVAMRRQYAQENLQTEANVARLQRDIERLSAINAPPSISIDTRPAVVGLSAAQQSSQQRQTLGLVGTRRAPARIGAIGLDIAS